MLSKRLYVVADVLTLARFVMAAELIFLAITKETDTTLALCCFAVGSLFDALDGAFARWARRIELEDNPDSPKPDRSRWVLLDQVADVVLGITVVIYVWRCVDPIFAWPVLCIGGPIAVVIQFLRQWDLGRNKSNDENQLSFWVYVLVMARRWAYVIILSFEIFVLVWYSPLTRAARAVVIFIGIFIGILLCTVKIDRLRQDKTPLSKIDSYKNDR